MWLAGGFWKQCVFMVIWESELRKSQIMADGKGLWMNLVRTGSKQGRKSRGESHSVASSYSFIHGVYLILILGVKTFFWETDSYRFPAPGPCSFLLFSVSDIIFPFLTHWPSGSWNGIYLSGQFWHFKLFPDLFWNGDLIGQSENPEVSFDFTDLWGKPTNTKQEKQQKELLGLICIYMLST